MYYISAIKPEVCQKIISHGLSKMVVDESKGISKTASTFDGKEKGGVDRQGNKVLDIAAGGATRETLAKKGIDGDKLYVRDSDVSWLNDKWLYDIFHPYVHHANAQAGWNWQWDFSESFQFTVYHGRKENGGFYGWHADGSSDHLSKYKAAIMIKKKPVQFKPPKRDEKGFVVMRPDGKPEPDMRAADIPLKRDKKTLAPGYTDNIHMWDKVRKLSMTIQLSDPSNYEGGELQLVNYANNLVMMEKYLGRVLVFDAKIPHKVWPVTWGERYALVGWVSGPQLR